MLLNIGGPPAKVALRMLLVPVLIWGTAAPGICQTHYRNQPFNPATKVLPPNYYGYDPAAFVQRARKELVKEQEVRTKGEFETTSQYKKRLQAEGSGSSFATKTYAFGVDPTAVSYDADKQTFTLKFAPPEAEKNVNYGWVTLQTTVKDAGHYQAENGFGAVTTVQKSSVSAYQLWLVRAKGLPGCTATAVVPPAKAKSINSDIRALVLVKPVAPYESVDREYSEATFTDPNETTTVNRLIFGRLVGVRFYDWITGRTLGSCP